ncbi:type III pantothenate kinase [Roseivirga sp. E12]|uniref:type III pantothenate kinase n=1 Tax=Roseivirga sp. E12 TaxID=2819237 RepID=UPI001ABC2C03|nr:type III pantothenate kinase [Roseivirga sp. E12]MBO3699844.1 type III pantothenate kinase [Roseivirga sp. E12]
MNLVIDFGNTNIKCGVFDADRLINYLTFADLREARDFINKDIYYQMGVCSVNQSKEYILKAVPELKNALFLSYDTPSPLKINYDTPLTLGMDRLAAAIGANTIFPNKPLMVIDVGTCITYDFVNKGVYEGGIISPGVELRYKSMNDYTKNLPLLNERESEVLIGKSTEQSMVSGVVNGIIGEIESHISQFMLNNADLKVIMTGGGAKIFESKIKSDIFVALEIVLVGMNRVLEYNVE